MFSFLMNCVEMEEEVLAATPVRACGRSLPTDSLTGDGRLSEDHSLKFSAHLSFTEAEEKKHQQKLHDFKQYLVDTRVVRVLVERARTVLMHGGFQATILNKQRQSTF